MKNMNKIPNTTVTRLGQLAGQLNEDANRHEEIAYHHQAEDVEDAAKCVETLQLLKRASNYSHFASVTVAIDGKPITTIGNLIAEAVGGLDSDQTGHDLV